MPDYNMTIDQPLDPCVPSTRIPVGLALRFFSPFRELDQLLPPPKEREKNIFGFFFFQCDRHARLQYDDRSTIGSVCTVDQNTCWVGITIFLTFPRTGSITSPSSQKEREKYRKIFPDFTTTRTKYIEDLKVLKIIRSDVFKLKSSAFKKETKIKEI